MINKKYRMFKDDNEYEEILSYVKSNSTLLELMSSILNGRGNLKECEIVDKFYPLQINDIINEDIDVYKFNLIRIDLIGKTNFFFVTRKGRFIYNELNCKN